MEQAIRTVQRRMTAAYLFWFGLYVVLGILMVLLPGLAAVAAFGPQHTTTLAVAATVASAMFAFLKPHEYATSYDAAKQVVWKVQIAHALGQIGVEEVAAGLERALDVTTFRYGGKSAAGGDPAGAALPAPAARPAPATRPGSAARPAPTARPD